MGNCAGYCNGTGDGDDQNQQQIKNSFNQKDLQLKDNDFEQKYGKRCSAHCYRRRIFPQAEGRQHE